MKRDGEPTQVHDSEPAAFVAGVSTTVTAVPTLAAVLSPLIVITPVSATEPAVILPAAVTVNPAPEVLRT